MLKTQLKRASWILFSVFLLAFTSKNSFTQTHSSLREEKTGQQEPLNDTLVQKLNAADSSLALAPKIVLNKQAKSFAADYVKKNKSTLISVERKSKPYFDMFDSVFTKYDLPLELKYLAVIESKLKPNAVSKVGAVGLWQFMPTTARNNGLKVKGKYDERKYSYKSTVAAAKHLRDLHKMFDDWLLVIAAYNGGAGTVYKAIKRSGSRDFWKLQYHLPLETRLHVKRFIGTHYYFEGGASLVTLTKKETTAYLALVQEIVEK
jgi:membrane-bound lytic murein transglycosylase D